MDGTMADNNYCVCVYSIISEFSSIKFHSFTAPFMWGHMIKLHVHFEFQWKPRNVSQIEPEICHRA